MWFTPKHWPMCVIGPKLSRCRAGIAFSITQELTAHLCSGGMPKCSGGHADGCLRVMDEVGLTILGYIRECQRRIADGLWWQNWSSFSLVCRLLRLASDLKNGYKLCLLPVCQLSSFAHLWCSMFNGFDLCINFGHYLLEPFEFFLQDAFPLCSVVYLKISRVAVIIQSRLSAIAVGYLVGMRVEIQYLQRMRK